MPFQPGDILHGQYEILAHIERGGFGSVYHARDVHLHEHVAIKELIPGLVGDPAMLRRFLVEAKATMRLRHERIVTTHTVVPGGDEADPRYYIVMEYMAGGPLERRLAAGPLPTDQALHIACQVAEGLAYAHSRGVVHCDLKPRNILFEGPERGAGAKVADFGTAHVSGELLTRSWHTAAGFIAGTLPYMSPEQADGVRDDPRIDVFGLGAVLYRMLTGRTYLDFDASETPRAQMENLQRIYSQQPRPIATYNPRVPAWLDAAVLKALAKRPEHRQQTVVALARDLARDLTPPGPALKPVPPAPHGGEGSAVEGPAEEPAGAPAELPARILSVEFADWARDRPQGSPPVAIPPSATEVEGRASTAATPSTGTPPPQEPQAAPPATGPKPGPTVLVPRKGADGGSRPAQGDQALAPSPAVPAVVAMPRKKAAGSAAPARPRWFWPAAGLAVVLAVALAFALWTVLHGKSPLGGIPACTRIGQTGIRNTDGMKMVCVPAGEFLMGSADDDPAAAPREKPQHLVTLDAFWIDQTEVTNGQYRRCVEAGACNAPATWGESGWNTLDQPVVGVSWNDAQDYAEWAGAQLPTEAQWEKAARGTDGRLYPWGDALSGNRLNFCDQHCTLPGSNVAVDDGYVHTAPAGSYPDGASPYGALDMAGNAMEWVADWFAEGAYDSTLLSNPEGPAWGTSRVLRGGSWDLNQLSSRAAARNHSYPYRRANNQGFRLVVIP